MTPKFEVWTEGWSATGGHSPAQFLGVYEGATFADACRAWAMEQKPSEGYTDPMRQLWRDGDPPTWWGCRFFDNEADARKAFG